MNTTTAILYTLLLGGLLAVIYIGAGNFAGDPSVAAPTRRFFNRHASVKWLADMVKLVLGAGTLTASYVGVTDPASLSLVQLMWGVAFVWAHHWLTLRADTLEKADKAAQAAASNEVPPAARDERRKPKS